MGEVKKITPLMVYKYLPGINCKKCGYSTCMMFASKLLLKEAKIEDCPILFEPKYREKLESLKELLKPLLETYETGLKLDEDKCTGCGNCVVVCPVNIMIDPQIAKGFGTMNDEVVMRVENGKLKIINLKKCRRFPPSRLDCRVCEEFCYTEAIKVY
ncbi:tRNA CCA-pyrophosphorylase [Candidatus Bathyarchaeota archaeon]|nr:MAG: tRNA CCA-pyrophosphorylase [Candidatus Bathyarchaeota archaeon]